MPSEYAPYAGDDISRVFGDDAVEALARQSVEFTELVSSLDDSRVHGLRYAPGKWTLKQVLGHMIDDERIFAYRALCIARGDARPLESFDENLYVAGANFEERALSSFLREYGTVRGATIALFDSLPPDAWLRRGTVTTYTATVRGLAFHIAGHELHHLTIIRERYLR